MYQDLFTGREIMRDEIKSNINGHHSVLYKRLLIDWFIYLLQFTALRIINKKEGKVKQRRRDAKEP